MKLEKYDIIIVEDNQNDAELMIRSLKENRLSNKMIVLENGEQALDFIYSKGKYANRGFIASPKVIFLDIKLPKLNGLEVLKQLKSDDRTKTIPVIIITSSKQDPDIETAYKLGANSYVVKPVDFDHFKNTINHLGLYWLVVNESV